MRVGISAQRSEQQNLSSTGLASSDGDYWQGGAVAKYTFGNTLLAASLSGGTGEFDITRRLFTGDTVKGTQDIWSVSGQVSAAHAFVSGDWYIKPRIDVGFDHIASGAFDEAGATGANLSVHGTDGTYYNVQPMVELGGEMRLSQTAVLRPSLSLGLTQFIGDASPTAAATFDITPTGVAPFMVSSDLDKTYFDLKGGLEFLGSDTYTMSLQGFGRFSENTTGYGGSGKFAVKF